MRILTALLLSLYVSAGSAQTYYRNFHDDFESYTLDAQLPTTKWDSSTHRSGGSGFGSSVPTVVDENSDASHAAHGGSKMVRLNWEGDGSANYGYTGVTFNFPADWGGATEIFIRFWARIDPNFADVNHIHWSRVTNIGDGGNDDFFVGDDALNFMTDGVNRYAPSAVFDPPSPFSNRDQWHKIEIYFKYSATTRVIAWNNGDLIDAGSTSADQSGFSWTGKFTLWDLASNWSSSNFPPDGANYIHIDDVEVFSDANWGDGTATTGSLSDASIQASAGGSTIRLPIRLSQLDGMNP